MSELAERVLTIEQGFVLEDHGLYVTRDLSENEWQNLGTLITRKRNGLTWALGDWLVYGGREEGGRWIGSGYAHAMQITGYSAPHLSNCFRVSSEFSREQRVGSVSWYIHRLVLALPTRTEQLRWLSEAQEKNWTGADVRARLDTLEAAEQQRVTTAEQPARTRHGRPKTGHANGYQLAQVRCPTCGACFPIRGHRVLGTDVVPIKREG